MRLPEKYQSRWVFALSAQLIGATFAIIAGLILFASPPFSAKCSEIGISLLYSSGTLFAAFLAWPSSEKRHRARMFFAGITTVALALLLSGLALGVFVLITQDQPVTFISLLSVPVMAILVLFFGSIITLGIPYLIAVLVAQIFVTTEA